MARGHGLHSIANLSGVLVQPRVKTWGEHPDSAGEPQFAGSGRGEPACLRGVLQGAYSFRRWASEWADRFFSVGRGLNG